MHKVWMRDMQQKPLVDGSNIAFSLSKDFQRNCPFKGRLSAFVLFQKAAPALGYASSLLLFVSQFDVNILHPEFR